MHMARTRRAHAVLTSCKCTYLSLHRRRWRALATTAGRCRWALLRGAAAAEHHLSRADRRDLRREARVGACGAWCAPHGGYSSGALTFARAAHRLGPNSGALGRGQSAPTPRAHTRCTGVVVHCPSCPWGVVVHSLPPLLEKLSASEYRVGRLPPPMPWGNQYDFVENHGSALLGKCTARCRRRRSGPFGCAAAKASK